MKTSELIGPALAYAVGIAEGCNVASKLGDEVEIPER